MFENYKEKEFDFIFDFIINCEGWESYNVYDPGGWTILGISEKHYPEVYSKLSSCINQVFVNKDLCLTIAKEFYFELWRKEKFYYLPYPFSVYSFDFRVNTGKRAVFTLQKMINKYSLTKINEDGIIGPETTNTLLDLIIPYNHFKYLSIYTIERIRYYNRLAGNKRFIRFLRGWINRSIKLMDLCYEKRDHFF